jgi:acetoin utilization deacetylase AcuC-like enzyme
VVQGAQLAWRNRSKVIVPDGGRHHASKNLSQGGCVFSDVPLAILKLRQSQPGLSGLKFLYIDTDVHHCNGFARSRFELGMQDYFFIMDLFNEDIWPCSHDSTTREMVNIPLAFHSGINNKTYLNLLRQGLSSTLWQHQ